MNKPEYTKILKGLIELPFQVGKNLLADYLRGNYKNSSISRNRLDNLPGFESMTWDKNKIILEIERLIQNNLIELVQSTYNPNIKLLSITIRGQNEIAKPTLQKTNLTIAETNINDNDKQLFKQYSKFLNRYNDEQKKAIISSAKNILCIAGAGAGKTTVLTKRIEFLIRYQKVAPEKILAITFTRKARETMQKRLQHLNIAGVNIHTFNSFCETILRKYESRIYAKKMRVINYSDKILALNMAVTSIGLDIDTILNEYFTTQQKQFKTRSQLINSFMSDCFAVIDYLKISEQEERDWVQDVSMKEKTNAERIYRIIKFLKKHMETQGLRDYTDQILDAVKFFKQYTSSIPEYSHILVDEYQDVNALQVRLLKLLNSPNMFVVGDPRQSIFGWRGSDINFILKFDKDFGETETIHLKKNYRSMQKIVRFMNLAIKNMELPDLDAHLQNNAQIHIKGFPNEDAEREFIIQELEKTTELDNTFILARTNKSLMELSQNLKAKKIDHTIRTDESRGRTNDKPKGVTLATVHAIKGLEAKKILIMAANEGNFPSRASDHPAIELIKQTNYNREEEERRLFYVAISRAREELVITHTKKASYYITDDMKKLIQQTTLEENTLSEELQSWRNIISNEMHIPPYIIMSNNTLSEIANTKPINAEELSKISGIGPEKLVKYGKQILDIVKEFGK